MNKSTSKQKRSMGKISPLSKRPKLDFTLTTRESFKESSNAGKKSPDICKKFGKDKLSENSSESEKDGNLSSTVWDDEFSGDMLEKVCLIADLSQAMVNNQPVPDLEKDKMDFFKKKLSPNSKPTLKTSEAIGSFEKLKLEFEKLQEKLKTKEGEVHILRSQLKQNEDAKQAAALQNIKVVEEIQERFNDKFNAVEKELESTKSKLLFKDLEYKTLSERCRQLEYNISKSKLAETQNGLKSFNCLSQGKNLALQSKETSVEKSSNVNDKNVKDECAKFEYFIPVYHEGRNLAKIICPEFFKFIEEPGVVPLYSFSSETEGCTNKVDKAKKYKWSDMPKQTVHIKDLYKEVGSLFTFENFTQKEVIKVIQRIFNMCEQILNHQIQIFRYLDKLQLCNVEYEKADRFLLEEEEEKVEIITIKNLLNCEKINEEECGIDLRRSLGLIHSLVTVSRTAFDMVKTNMTFMRFFKDIVASIGKLRRPSRYTGILAGISFILQRLLEEEILEGELLNLITETVEEMIFARPKLNVLREVVNVLAAGKHNMSLLSGLCRRESVDSCMLYMDCKLKQAMFFTKNACPLKLLCMQIMGLTCLPCNQDIRWDVTDCVIKWLNSSLSTQNSKNLKWLPVNPRFMEEDKCFNVTECLLFLLILCLNDYNLNFQTQDNIDENITSRKAELEKKKNYLISIIGQGAVLFKRILKADQRQLHENSYSVRFCVLLTALQNKSSHCQVNHVSLSSVEMEAISWINDLLESDLRVQDCCLKQNFSALSEIEVFNALKICGETRIF